MLGIDFEVLKHISDADIRDLIPREKLGLRVKFKQKLIEWRNINVRKHYILKALF